MYTKKQLRTIGTKIVFPDIEITVSTVGRGRKWVRGKFNMVTRECYGTKKNDKGECLVFDIVGYTGSVHFITPFSELERIGMLKKSKKNNNISLPL